MTRSPSPSQSAQVFRFDERKNHDGPRFVKATKDAEGKRLTYKRLTAKG